MVEARWGFVRGSWIEEFLGGRLDGKWFDRRLVFDLGSFELKKQAGRIDFGCWLV